MTRRKFKRPIGQRRYKKLFVIASEGAKTEPQYFKMLNAIDSVIHFKCLKNKHDSSPNGVLKLMKGHIRSNSLKKTDEAWLVIDKDRWTDQQINQLYSWSEEKDSYNLALSNPKFEYWLLLHFENGSGISSSRNCSERLERYLPDYNKDIQETKLKPKIRQATERAKAKDTPPCPDWPRRTGTTVYKLVEKLYAD